MPVEAPVMTTAGFALAWHVSCCLRLLCAHDICEDVHVRDAVFVPVADRSRQCLMVFMAMHNCSTAALLDHSQQVE
jgi:hypothetical protein